MTSAAATSLLGYTAAAVGSVLMLPQVLQSWRTRQVNDLSMGMVLLYLINCALWMAYGGLEHSGPILLANGVGLVIGAAQLGMKLAFRARRGAGAAPSEAQPRHGV